MRLILLRGGWRRKQRLRYGCAIQAWTRGCSRGGLPVFFNLMNRRAAISALDRPCATSRSTSSSRLLRSSRFFGPVRPLTPRSRRNAAAASASGIAPSRSNAAKAARASEIATGSVSLHQSSGQLHPRTACLERQRGLAKGLGGLTQTQNGLVCEYAEATLPAANKASPRCRLLLVNPATTVNCAAASAAASRSPRPMWASTRTVNSGNAATVRPPSCSRRRTNRVDAVSGERNSQIEHR